MMSRPSVFQQIRTDIKGFGFKQWFLLALNVVLVLASLACGLGLRGISGTLDSVTAARRFQGESETRFAQVACYLPVGQGKVETDILSFRQSLDTKLVEQSLEAPENGKLYLDAYSGSGKVSVSADNGSATVEAVGVGGISSTSIPAAAQRCLYQKWRSDG